MKDVTRAPLVPSDSLETWTRTSWPLRSISSIGPTASRRALGSLAVLRVAASTSALCPPRLGEHRRGSSSPRLAV